MYRIGQEEIDAVARVIEQRSLFKINNKLQETMHAEEEIKALFGTKYPLLMTNGYAALTCALIGMGIGPGDEVIVPAYTYISTAMAVVSAGAMPVIAEVDETLTLCPEDTERKITPRTKAIIPVHIQGLGEPQLGKNRQDLSLSPTVELCLEVTNQHLPSPGMGTWKE